MLYATVKTWWQRWTSVDITHHHQTHEGNGDHLCGDKVDAYISWHWPRCSIWQQELLREAAKARIRRMVAPHKSRKGLEVPDFVKDAWKSRDQNSMAKLLMDVNWDKDCMLKCLYIYTRRMFTCTSSLFSAVNGFLDRSNLSWNVISVLPMLASAGEVHQHSRGDHSQEKCDHGVGGWGMAHRKRNEGERMDCDPCM